MKKQPVVYVEREVLKHGCGQSYYTYGYIVSKAYLKTKTENYLDDGQVKINYEVEYIGYDDVNENIEGKNYALANSYYAPKTRIYNDFQACQNSTQRMNESLFLRRVSTLDEKATNQARAEYNVVKNLILNLEQKYLLGEDQTEEE